MLWLVAGCSGHQPRSFCGVALLLIPDNLATNGQQKPSHGSYPTVLVGNL
jgi:hypothetical protein